MFFFFVFDFFSFSGRHFGGRDLLLDTPHADY